MQVLVDFHVDAVRCELLLLLFGIDCFRRALGSAFRHYAAYSARLELWLLKRFTQNIHTTSERRKESSMQLPHGALVMLPSCLQLLKRLSHVRRNTDGLVLGIQKDNHGLRLEDLLRSVLVTLREALTRISLSLTGVSGVGIPALDFKVIACPKTSLAAVTLSTQTSTSNLSRDLRARNN